MHEWFSLWFMTHIFRCFPSEFPRMRLSIEFEYHWDLFISRFISQMENAKVYGEKYQITAREIWPQWRMQRRRRIDHAPSKKPFRHSSIAFYWIWKEKGKNEPKFVYIWASSVISIEATNIQMNVLLLH